MTRDAETADRFARGSADDLRAELERLREDNADLRASALLWQRLYEHAIAAAEPASTLLPAAEERLTPLQVDVSFAHRAREAVGALFTAR